MILHLFRSRSRPVLDGSGSKQTLPAAPAPAPAPGKIGRLRWLRLRLRLRIPAKNNTLAIARQRLGRLCQTHRKITLTSVTGGTNSHVNTCHMRTQKCLPQSLVSDSPDRAPSKYPPQEPSAKEFALIEGGIIRTCARAMQSPENNTVSQSRQRAHGPCKCLENIILSISRQRLGKSRQSLPCIKRLAS